MAHLVRLKQGRSQDTSVIPLPPEGLTLGRDATCGCCLEDVTVSRCHAEIRRIQENWELQDLGSRNGTFLNRARTERAILRHGDFISVGRAAFHFEDPQPPRIRPLPEPEALSPKRPGLLVALPLVLVLAGAMGAWWHFHPSTPMPEAPLEMPAAAAIVGPKAQSEPPTPPQGPKPPQAMAAQATAPPQAAPSQIQALAPPVQTPPQAAALSAQAPPQAAALSAQAPSGVHSMHISLSLQVQAHFAPPYTGNDQEWDSEQDLMLELTTFPVQGTGGFYHGRREGAASTDDLRFRVEEGQVTSLHWRAQRRLARTFEDGRHEPLREDQWEIDMPRMNRQHADMFQWHPGQGPSPKMTYAVSFFPGGGHAHLTQALWTNASPGHPEPLVKIHLDR